jgi:nitrite reductase/ring-hydroxylating ferredoxin subunit
MKAEDYTQGDAFQAEKRSLFGAGWLPVCASGQVPKAGDFQSVTVGGWSVIAVRGEDGAVRVLRNACRHQNMPVANTPWGNCQNFRCRFHGWTYDLKGRFQSAPPQFAPPPTQTERDLLSLATVERHGLMFFSMAEPAPPPSLDPLPDYRGTLVTDIPANWKVVVEHLLASQPVSSADFTWLPPLLAMRRAGTTAIVEQIVPHTFLRTRLFTHVFGDDASGHKQAAAGIAHACELLQADRAEGRLAPGDDARVAGFHKSLDEVYAGSS